MLRISPSLPVITVMLPLCGLIAAAEAQQQRITIHESYERTIEIEARGPVHEAFAEPVLLDPEPGLIVPRRVPDPIVEVPPDERPEGDNVAWIPGYWSWDDDRDDYLWVSGTWRNMPPGRQFVPGYWSNVSQGYQWNSGFWALSNAEYIQYLPEPPPTLEVGPMGAPPSPTDVWVPGAWLWQEVRYVWRPGYWLPVRPDWVWVPARYVWTPRGYIYVGGYWDYALPRRGLLFAPVYVERPVYVQPAFVYTPTVVVNVTTFAFQLFARPSYGHYYFGDYYEPRYVRAGILPAYEFHSTRRGYSPLYATYAAIYRGRDPSWEDRLRRQYRYLREHPDYRPPRTYQALRELESRGELRRRVQGRQAPVTLSPDIYNVARPLTELAQTGLPTRLQRLDRSGVEEIRKRSQAVRQYQAQRMKLETQRGPQILQPGESTNRELSAPERRTAQPDRQVVRPGGTSQGTTSGAPQQGETQRPSGTPTIRPGQATSGTQYTIRPGGTTAQNESATGSATTTPPRVALPRSPVAGKPLKEWEQTVRPPARPKVPKVDPDAKPPERTRDRTRRPVRLNPTTQPK